MHLKISTYYPNDVLKPFIKNYHIVGADSTVDSFVLPDSAPVMIFRFKGNLSQSIDSELNGFPMSAVSGLRNSVRLFRYSPGSSHIVVRLKEASANVFFDEPLNEFYKNSISLRDLSGYEDLSKLEDQLSSACSNEERIGLLEGFLAMKLRRHSIDARIVSAVDTIIRAEGNVRMNLLADQHHLSQDAFEKRFRKVVGSPPKTFSNIIRLKTVIAKGIDGRSLAEISVNAGFFDQAHFNKDFKLFTGRNPSQFFAEKQPW